MKLGQIPPKRTGQLSPPRLELLLKHNDQIVIRDQYKHHLIRGAESLLRTERAYSSRSSAVAGSARPAPV